MSKRNALQLIERALKEKTVEVVLPGRDNSIKGYLIKISGDVDPFRDFRAMYRRIDKKVSKEIEQRLRREERGLLKNHGVLIEPGTLKMIFTFNMAFADLHIEGKRFLRFPPIEIFPIVIPDYYGHPCRDGDPCFGERAKELVEKYEHFPREKVVSCLSSFKDTLSKHIVSVKLPGETIAQKLYLIKIWAKTDIKEDYRISYPGLGSKLLVSSKEEFREYGLFIRPKDLAIVFAFNVAFAKYDRESKTVEYSTVGDILLKDLQQLTVEPVRKPSFSLRPSSGMSGVIMYALSEPRK